MNKGITLIEMLVVLAIISIMGAVIFFNVGTVNDNLALKEAVDDVSLAFRQAQIEGLAVLENPAREGDFDIGYGLYFNRGEQEGEYSFVYYVDNDVTGTKNDTYDGDLSCGSGTECQKLITLDNGVTISSICGRTGSSRCAESLNNKDVSITFSRPRPRALIKSGSSEFSLLKVTLETESGETAEVTLSAGGEVSIEK